VPLINFNLDTMKIKLIVSEINHYWVHFQIIIIQLIILTWAFN